MLWRKYEHKLQILGNIKITRKVIIHTITHTNQENLWLLGCKWTGLWRMYLSMVHFWWWSHWDSFIEIHLFQIQSGASQNIVDSSSRTVWRIIIITDAKNIELLFTDGVLLWTDSHIVLCWLRSCSRQWNHVPSEENPANLL